MRASTSVDFWGFVSGTCTLIYKMGTPVLHAHHGGMCEMINLGDQSEMVHSHPDQFLLADVSIIFYVSHSRSLPHIPHSWFSAINFSLRLREIIRHASDIFPSGYNDISCVFRLTLLEKEPSILFALAETLDSQVQAVIPKPWRP